MASPPGLGASSRVFCHRRRRVRCGWLGTAEVDSHGVGGTAASGALKHASDAKAKAAAYPLGAIPAEWRTERPLTGGPNGSAHFMAAGGQA
jgi:hypothetical protein